MEGRPDALGGSSLDAGGPPPLGAEMTPDGGCPDAARAAARPPDPTQGLPRREAGGSPEGGVPSAPPASPGDEGAPPPALEGSAGARPEDAGFGGGQQLPHGRSGTVREAGALAAPPHALTGEDTPVYDRATQPALMGSGGGAISEM
eukprot:14694587-Alexandrium_andersonii.AAC.1